MLFHVSQIFINEEALYIGCSIGSSYLHLAFSIFLFFLPIVLGNIKMYETDFVFFGVEFFESKILEIILILIRN